MSFADFEKAFKNRVKFEIRPEAKTVSMEVLHIVTSYEKSFGKVEAEFTALKKQLQEFLTFLYSQAPLFCTHGQNELDCMKSNSPCKRKHQKDCPVYLRINKSQELLGK